MKRFSIGASIGEAVRLIGRRPFAVFVWGLLLVAPTFGALGLMLPAMGEMFANMPPPGAGDIGEPPFSDDLFADMMQIQLASLLANFGQYLAMVLVYAAIFRAIIRPRDTTFFSLRIGMDELRVAVAGLAIGIGIYGVMIFGILVCVALGFALWGQGAATALWVVGIVGLALLLAILWGLARVSLIAPASLHYRDFAFVQGWRLASGQSWRLLGMLALIYLMIMAVYIVVIIIVSVLAGGLIAANSSGWETMNHDANPFAGMSAWTATNWPWLIVGGLVMSWVYGAFMTLVAAPFASACRQLAEPSAPPAAEEIPSPEPAH